MEVEIPRLRVVRHASELGSWEMVSGEPDPRLRAHVLNYTGYVERTPGPMRRREFPAPQVVLIIDFGPSLKLLDPSSEAVRAQHRAGFVAGLDDSFSLTETPGAGHGLQVNFTPIGARLFFGLPMHELARRVVGLEDVFGSAGRALTEQLQHTPSWEARFALLDRLIVRRISEARAVSDCVAWSWRRLEQTGGLVDIGVLAEETGFSRKHLISRFHEEIGLPPKLLGRLMRFDRVLRLLKSGGGGGRSWAELALDHGYYDQAHLIRDFRQFTGSPPSEFLRRQLPDSGGVSG